MEILPVWQEKLKAFILIRFHVYLCLMKRNVSLKKFKIGEGQQLAVMTGPCVIEGEDHCLQVAESLKKIFF